MEDGNRSAHSSIADIIAALLLVVMCTMALGEEAARSANAPAQMSRGPALFCRERLHYDIGFWLFRNAAVGHLTFSKTPQGYEALFEAESTGLVKIIAGHRKEIMRSVMEFDETTGRLRPLIFQEVFTYDRREMDKMLTFNYYDNTYTVSVEMDSQCILYRTRTLPVGTFEDLLTFFYNLRMDHYGPVEPGLSLQVCLLMTVRPSYLGISFHNDENGRHRGEYYCAVLNMEKNLTQARSSTITCRFSRDLIPVYGVVEDAYYFGDLTVRLTGRDVTGIP